ncbi:hypothetical protein, partial [Salmonella enterica]|uniref:hypothetical protein n=1 Tax=Salmonella enterica TaxID=28901 RepID=UPI001C60C8DB
MIKRIPVVVARRTQGTRVGVPRRRLSRGGLGGIDHGIDLATWCARRASREEFWRRCRSSKAKRACG